MSGLMGSSGLKKTLKYVDIIDSRTIDVPEYPNLSPTYYVNVRSKLPPEIYQKLTKENVCAISTFAYSTVYSTNENYVGINILNYYQSSGQIDFNVSATYGGRIKNIPFRVFYIE